MPPAALHSSLHAWWSEHLPLDVPTLFAGVGANTHSLSEWFELWIDAADHLPRRTTHPAALDATVTVHVFAKTSNDLTRVHRLAEAARATLEHQTIPLHDPTQSGRPLVGHARLHEPTLRDLTRPLQTTTPHLHHLVLTFPARAEATAVES